MILTKSLLPLLLTFVLYACNGQTESSTSPPTPKSEVLVPGSVSGPDSTIVRTLIQDRAGDIWITSFKGLYRYDGEVYTRVSEGVTDHRFFGALDDSKGNLWFTTIGGGVFYYNGKSFRNYTKAHGLAGNEVTDVYEDDKGAVWFGTEEGLSRFDGLSFKNYTTGDGLPSVMIDAITQDKEGNLWIGTRGGIAVYDGESFEPFNLPDGTSFGNIQAIFRDSDGNMWLGGRAGLWRYDGSELVRYTDVFVGHIYEDGRGNLLTSSEAVVGSEWALSRYDADRLSDPTAAPTVLATAFMIFGILEDREGRVWYGSNRVNRI